MLILNKGDFCRVSDVHSVRGIEILVWHRQVCIRAVIHKYCSWFSYHFYADITEK